MIWLVALVVILVALHYTVFSPLFIIWYYKRQGIDEWKFFPILGWQIKNMRGDLKAHKDIMYSLRMYLRDGRV